MQDTEKKNNNKKKASLNRNTRIPGDVTVDRAELGSGGASTQLESTLCWEECGAALQATGFSRASVTHTLLGHTLFVAVLDPGFHDLT